MKRRSFLSATGVLTAAYATSALPATADGALSYARYSAALSGYDSVAYHTEGKAVPGTEEVTVWHEGQAWLFTSEDNAAVFRKNPELYAPAYGGFCALAMAFGKKLPGDPDAWAVVDGRLYLNVNLQAQETWQEDPAGFIADADAKWPELKNVHPDEL
ncbi:YHS domain-containing protein [Rhodobacteraceae bacterium NNCM2]|nr:YHS domain-containing protein [Coraliihabitans acroporae]